MKSAILIFSCLTMLLLPTLVCAQNPALNKDSIYIEDNHSSRVCPLGNTVSNNIVIFYSSDGQIVTKVLNTTTKNLIGTHVVAELQSTTESSFWDVRWHPKAKVYMLVYVMNGKLYAQRVKSNGITSKGKKFICNYPGTYVHVAWTNKKRFVVFLQRNEQISALVLRKNGKTSKSEENITNDSNYKYYPCTVDTDGEGRAVVYFSRYDSTQETFRPGLMDVDHKLRNTFRRLFTDYHIASGNSGNWQKSSVRGAYDKGSSCHGLVWSYDAGFKIATTNLRGQNITAPKSANFRDRAVRLFNDPDRNCFVVYIEDYLIDNPEQMDRARIYFNAFNKNGNYVIAEEEFLTETSDETYNYWAGCSRNGKYIFCWVQEQSGSWDNEVRSLLVTY